MANIVLIAGSGHGGWGYDPITEKLRKLGHKVFAITLSGLDHEKPVAQGINLDTHIEDVLKVIEANNLEDVFLVGHSYGGMVVTGVADRTKAKVTGLFYIDAMVPKPGESLWSLLDQAHWYMFLASSPDGLFIYPDEAFKAIRPRVMPHPLGTMLQPLSYSDSIFENPNKTYIYAEKYFNNPALTSPFAKIFSNLAVDPGWKAISMPYGHDIFEEAPDEVFEILVSALTS